MLAFVSLFITLIIIAKYLQWSQDGISFTLNAKFGGLTLILFAFKSTENDFVAL